MPGHADSGSRHSAITVLAAAVLTLCIAGPTIHAQTVNDDTTGAMISADDASGAAPAVRDDIDAELHARAEQGDVRAALILATRHYTGIGAPRDEASALRYWTIAARHGDIDAAYNLGLLMLTDKTRVEEARGWLTQAADAGDVMACFALGTSLAESNDPALHANALAWLERAAHAGYAPAQYNLARVLETSTAPDQRARAQSWYAAAAPTFAPAEQAVTRLDAGSASAPTATTPSAQIHDVEWVLSRSPDHYTLQISAGRTPGSLQQLLSELALPTDTAWFLHRADRRQPYTAVLGEYVDYASAERALAELPDQLKSNAPWIRRFAVLQQELHETTPPPDR